jgi:hypothetical protein
VSEPMTEHHRDAASADRGPRAPAGGDTVASSANRGLVVRAARWLWAENLALPFAAALVGIGELALLRAVYQAAFAGQARVGEATSLPLGHAVLWVTGLTGAALACSAAYRLLRYGRGWLAAPVVLAICFPLMILALGGLYGSLVLLAIL